MATNMFRLLIRPIAHMQVIGYLECQPTHRRPFSTDSEPEQEGVNGKEGSAIKTHLVRLLLIQLNEYCDSGTAFLKTTSVW